MRRLRPPRSREGQARTRGARVRGLATAVRLPGRRPRGGGGVEGRRRRPALPRGREVRQRQRDRGPQDAPEARRRAPAATDRRLLHRAHARHALGADGLFVRARAPLAPLRKQDAGGTARDGLGRRDGLRPRHHQVLGPKRGPLGRQARDRQAPPRAPLRRQGRGHHAGLAARELRLPRLAGARAVPRAAQQDAGRRGVTAPVVRHGRADAGVRRAQDAPRLLDWRRLRQGLCGNQILRR